MKEINGWLNKLYFTNFSIIVAIVFSIILMFYIQFKVEKLQDIIATNNTEISNYEDQIRLLEVEWVYLTRPERLRQISKQFLKENDYALASQIKEGDDIQQFYNANYKIEGGDLNKNTAKQDI